MKKAELLLGRAGDVLCLACRAATGEAARQRTNTNHAPGGEGRAVPYPIG